MADEAFRHKFSSESEWEISPRSRSSLLFLPFFFLFIFLPVPLPLPFPFFFSRFFPQTPADKRTPPGNQHLRNAIWAFQRHKEKTNNAGKTRGINTLPSWCWTNMSRSLQFTNGPATFGAHRCGNSRTNLIAPVAAVVVFGFVCLSCLSLYCLTDSLLEGCAPLNWQRRDGCS